MAGPTEESKATYPIYASARDAEAPPPLLVFSLAGRLGSGAEIRHAIREGWDAPQSVRDALVNDIIVPALDAPKRRLTLAAICSAIDMVQDNRGGFDRHPSRRNRQPSIVPTDFSVRKLNL